MDEIQSVIYYETQIFYVDNTYKEDDAKKKNVSRQRLHHLNRKIIHEVVITQKDAFFVCGSIQYIYRGMEIRKDV